MAFDISTYLKTRHQQRKNWAIKLLGGKCVQCSSQENLEFDHVDPTTKTINVSDILGRWSEKRLAEELKKCQLLCSPCHLIKTHANKENRGYGFSEHGEARRYQNGCRCTLCVEKQRERSRAYMKAYRLRKTKGI